MKLLYLSEYFKSGYGVSLVIKEQSKRLLRNYNVEVAVGSFYIDDVSYNDGIRVIRLPEDRAVICEIIKNYSPDVVVAHTPYFFDLISRYEDATVLKIAYDHGEPFAEFFEDKDYNDRKRIEIDKREAIMKFQLHISISEFIKKTSRVKDSFVIYNGCEHLKRDTILDKKDFRKTYNFSDHTLIISSLSRIGKGEAFYKGFDLLVEIKNRLQKMLPNIGFILMGRIAEEGDVILRQLEKEGICVMPDVDEKTKADILSMSDIFLSTSLWEGFNLPLIEAQYNGVVSICFSTGAHPEVCPFHFMSIDEMITFITELYENRDILASYGEISSDFVKKCFSWDKNAKQFYQYVSEKLQIHKTRGLPILNSLNEPLEDSFEQDCSGLIQRHLQRIGYDGIVEKGLIQGTYIFKSKETPKGLVSIIIPNSDCADILRVCVDSIMRKSSYRNFEILIVENGSKREDTFSLYEELKEYSSIKILNWGAPFNYSAVNNFAFRHSQGDYILFLNNDVEVINDDWLERLLDQIKRKEVGIVGAKMYYPNNTIQHAGVLIGVNDIGCHAHKGFRREDNGYFGRLKVVHNVSAVTGACMITRRDVFLEVEGFDENLPIAFNDIDYCLKVRQKGYLIIWTPLVELYHHESLTRGVEDTDSKKERFRKEVEYFKSKWSYTLSQGDPYYNPNLTLNKEDFSIRTE